MNSHNARAYMENLRREADAKRAKEETLRLMANVDLLWSSPQERAEEVWQLIQHGCALLKADLPSGYDLLCFNAEALGKAAIGLQNPELLSLTSNLLRWIYSAHYNQPQDVMGDPDKVTPPEPESEASQQEATPDLQDGEYPSPQLLAQHPELREETETERKEDALQHEQGSGGEESPLPPGHARSSENPDVAELGPAPTLVQDQGGPVRGPISQ